ILDALYVLDRSLAIGRFLPRIVERKTCPILDALSDDSLVNDPGGRPKRAVGIQGYTAIVSTNEMVFFDYLTNFSSERCTFSGWWRLSRRDDLVAEIDKTRNTFALSVVLHNSKFFQIERSQFLFRPVVFRFFLIGIGVHQLSPPASVGKSSG